MAPWPDSTDRRPGVLPEIFMEGQDVIFRFAVAAGTIVSGARLVLRCDRDGELWASICRKETPGKNRTI